MIVDIYASGTDCIIESKEYTGKALTVADLIAECAPDMKKGLPLAFELDGAPADRHSMLRGHARLAIHLQPCYGWEFVIAAIIIAIAAAVFAAVMMSKAKKKQGGASDKNKGSSIYDPNVQANQAKLLSPIPQQFGYMKRFPDYLNERHSFYLNNKKYETLLLSLGIGWFDISGTYIGNIPRESLAGKSFVRYYDPGEKIRDLMITGSGTTAYSMHTENGKLVIRDDVTGLQTEDEDYTYNLAPYKNWYNSPDVQGIQLNAKKGGLIADSQENTFSISGETTRSGIAFLTPWMPAGVVRASFEIGNAATSGSLPAESEVFTMGSCLARTDKYGCANVMNWMGGYWTDTPQNYYQIIMTYHEKLPDAQMRVWELMWFGGVFYCSHADEPLSGDMPADSVSQCIVPFSIPMPIQCLRKVELVRYGSKTDITVTAHGHGSDMVDGKYPVFDVSFVIHTDFMPKDGDDSLMTVKRYEKKNISKDYSALDNGRGIEIYPIIAVPYHKLDSYTFNSISVTRTDADSGVPDESTFGKDVPDWGSSEWLNYVKCDINLPTDASGDRAEVIKCTGDLSGTKVALSADDLTYSDVQVDGKKYVTSFSGVIGAQPQWGFDNLSSHAGGTWLEPGNPISLSFTAKPVAGAVDTYKGYTPYAYRPQPIGKPITHFQVSINFPGGLYHMKDNGDYSREDVTIYVAYRKINTAEWIVDTHVVSGETPDEKGFTYEYDVPKGEYEVKVGLQGSEDSQANNQGSWENLAGIIGEKQVYEGMTTVFCCAQSSNIFSGTNNNQISSFCTRQRNNSGTRVEMSTIEDAAIYLVQSSKYFSMPARLDYAAFKNAQAKYWSGITVNGVFDEKSTFWDCLQDVLKIGFAEPIVRGNVISVAVDRSHKDEAYKYVFHADNIIGDVSVSCSYPTATTIIEYEVQYTDPDTWKQAVVYVAYVPKDSYDMTGEEQDRFFLSESEYRLLKADDTYANYLGSGRKVRGGERSEGRIYESDSAMTESPQTLELWGVTDRDRAILIAVRALRRQVYITRNFSFSVDLSALNVQYLDYVGLFIPYSTAGISGVIRDVAKTDSGYAYLNVKTNSGRSLDYSDAYTQEADGTARKLTAVPQRNAESYWEQPNPDTWKVTGADSVTADDAGMPIVCGKAIPCLVQSVTPDAEKAKVELSEYSEEIYGEAKVYTRRGDTFDFSYYGDPSRTIA